MIEWRKWNAYQLFEIDRLYLVQRRSTSVPEVVKYRNDAMQGTLFFGMNGYAVMDITHFSPINLPGEET